MSLTTLEGIYVVLWNPICDHLFQWPQEKNALIKSNLPPEKAGIYQCRQRNEKFKQSPFSVFITVLQL